jgi:uncharacterized protein YukE
MPDGFTVEPERLRAVARAFSAEARDLGAAIPGYQSQVTDVEEAFGLLGPSTELYYEYMGLARDCVSALGQLRQGLEATATGLEGTADTYLRSDQSSAIPGAGP